MEYAARILLNGANVCCPHTNEDIAYKTQVLLDCRFRVPVSSSPVDQIIAISPNVFYHRVTLIPGPSLCGSLGYKISVSGILDVAIEYVGADDDQYLCITHYNPSYHGLICGTCDGEPIYEDSKDLVKGGLHTCIEYLDVEPVDRRAIQLVAVLMIWIDSRGKCLRCIQDH